jgi:hypothetical protein
MHPPPPDSRSAAFENMDTDQFWLDELLAAHGDDAGNLTCGTIHPRDPDAPGTGHEEAHQAVVVSDLAHSQAPQAILTTPFFPTGASLPFVQDPSPNAGGSFDLQDTYGILASSDASMFTSNDSPFLGYDFNLEEYSIDTLTSDI